MRRRGSIQSELSVATFSLFTKRQSLDNTEAQAKRRLTTLSESRRGSILGERPGEGVRDSRWILRQASRDVDRRRSNPIEITTEVKGRRGERGEDKE